MPFVPSIIQWILIEHIVAKNWEQINEFLRYHFLIQVDRSENVLIYRMAILWKQ